MPHYRMRRHRMQSTVSEQPERFFVSELIREKIFLLYEQEIPYSVQVRTAVLLYCRSCVPVLHVMGSWI